MHNFGGGRSDLFNSGGRWSKGGGIFSKFRGELKKFRGVWTLDEAMALLLAGVFSCMCPAIGWCI